MPKPLSLMTRSGPIVLFFVLLMILLNRLQSRSLTNQVGTLEREKTELVEFARRLSESRRVAQVNVLEQTVDERGQVVSRLRWQEISTLDQLSDPVEIEVIGEQAYFEAFVIKFDHDLVGNGDHDRGNSVALFRRVFGEGQVPQSARPLEQLRGAVVFDPVGPPLSRDRLWARFWEFADDPETASQFGIRVAQLEAPAVKLKKGQVWEVTLDASGGVNVKLVTAPPRIARKPESAPRP